MLLLFIGLLLMLLAFGLLVADMDRRRRQLGDMINRAEPLVDRSRRLHVRNMRGLNNSLFYSSTLFDQLEREITAVERLKGLETPTAETRYSLWARNRYRRLDERIDSLAALAAPAPEPTATEPTEPAESVEPS